MSRVIVLILCLASAGGIAAYAHYFRDTGEPVYTVTQRAPEAVTKPSAALPPPHIETPGDRASLARALQRELKRVGCYDGDITGVWTTSSRMAMKAFTERVNATLPIDTPDYVLLSLVQGHRERACGVACPAGQSATGSGACVPSAVAAKPAPADGKADAPADKSSTALPAAGAATALALAAPAVGPAPDSKAAADSRVRPAAVAPAPQDAPEKKPLGERTARPSGPVPPEGVHEKRPRRTAASRPPKVVRDFLRTFGFK